MFHSSLKESTRAKVLSVKERKMVKGPPPALKTVDMLRAASIGYKIGPQLTMRVTEDLYTRVRQ